MITDELIMNHTLQECLEAFQGAEGDSVATRETCVKTVFKILAKKFLYGGYFCIPSSSIITKKTKMEYMITSSITGTTITRRSILIRSLLTRQAV